MHSKIWYLHNISGLPIAGDFEIDTTRFEINHDKNSFIFGKEGDLQFQSPRISRNHAEFYFEKEVLLIKDLESTNGTKLNGIKIESNQSIRVNVNDIVAFGGVDWIITYEKEFQPDWLKKPYISVKLFTQNEDQFELVQSGYASVDAAIRNYGGLFENPTPKLIIKLLNSRSSYYTYTLVE